MRYRAFAPHHTPRFAPSHPEPAGGRSLPLAGYRQARNYTCGYACALMVLRFFKPETRGLDLFRRLGTGTDGTRQTAIVRELRAAGLGANVRYDVDFARLRREIDRNKLIIGYLHDIDHWVVLYGYGAEPRRVFIADPRPMEPCERPWPEFRERLRDFGIVVSDPVSKVVVLPPTSEPDEERESVDAEPVQLALFGPG